MVKCRSKNTAETLAIGLQFIFIETLSSTFGGHFSINLDAFSCCTQYLTIMVTMMETMATVMVSMVAVPMVAVSMVTVSMMMVSMVTVSMMVVSMAVMAKVMVMPMAVPSYNREIHFMRFEQSD